MQQSDRRKRQFVLGTGTKFLLRDSIEKIKLPAGARSTAGNPFVAHAHTCRNSGCFFTCRILRHLAAKEQRVTPRQLVEAWRAKKGAKAMPVHVVADPDRPNRLSRSTCERLVLQLLGLGVLSDDFHFTAFSVVHYVVTGARAHALESGRLPSVLFDVPEGEGKGEARAGEKKTKTKNSTNATRTDVRQVGGEETRKGREKDARGGGSGGVSPKPKDRVGATASERGNRDRGKKRAKAQVDDAVAAVDLCGTEDEQNGFRGDEDENDGRCSGRNERYRDGGLAQDAGVADRSGGDNVGGGRGSCSGALGDDDDSDDFEPIDKRPKKTAAKKPKKAQRVFDSD